MCECGSCCGKDAVTLLQVLLLNVINVIKSLKEVRGTARTLFLFGFQVQ